MSLDTFLQSNSSDLSYPSIRPTLNLNFAKTKTLDPRITFSRNSIGTYVGADGYIKYAVANEPRFDHDPITGKCLGLLLEEQRTNTLRYSQSLGTSPWSVYELTIQQNAIIAPDNTLTATSLIATNTNSIHRVAMTSGGVSATPTNEQYRFSCYFKFNGHRYVGFFCNINAGIYGHYDLINGTAAVGSIQSVGNGWYRCISSQYPASSNNSSNTLSISLTTSSANFSQEGNSFLGDGVSGVYAWGAQSEVGTYPTSYIPTSGSTVTRLADSATITGTNFSSWYNSSGGTLLSIGEQNYSSLSSNSLIFYSNSPAKNTISNVLYYPTVLNNITLKSMNSYAISPPPIITSNLLINLDAGNTQSYSGPGSTTWTDLSGNGNTGTLVNGVGYNSSNLGSLVFDGFDDYISFLSNPNLTNQITVEVWVKLNSTTPNGGGWILGRESSYRMLYSSSSFTWVCSTVNNSWYSAGTDISTSVSATSGIFQVIGTYDGSNNRIYVNGTLRNIGSAISGNILATSNYNLFRSDAGNVDYGKGNLYAHRLYNRALTATEIQQNFNAFRGRFGL